jgi:hypothetical protein
MKKREVWKELYYRYFTQGRQFNLYRILRGEPIPFGNTISWELSAEEVEIPTEHAEDFIKNLLDFIEFVDRQVLASDNLQFEWQLHELAGMKSMIERVRDAKIKDMNTRQKVNLFIDKINNARKNALLQIEEAKAAAAAAKPEFEHEVKPEQQIIISEERTALMKQELVHLDIPISKVTKSHWMEMIEHLHMYYPEDQKRIVRHGIKKYPYEITRKHPWQTFIENREIRNPEINMIGALFGGIEKSGLIHWFQHLGLSTLEDFMTYVRDWFFEAENATDESFDELRRELLREIGEHSNPSLNGKDNPVFYEARRLYNEYLLSDLDDHFWIVEKHENGKLSDMLDLAPNDYISRPEYVANRVAKVKYSPSGEVYVEEPERRIKQLSILDLYYSVLDTFNRKLAWNEESYLRIGEKLSIAEIVPPEYHTKIRRFFQLPLTLEIDPGCGHKPDRPTTNPRSIEAVFIYKFIRGAIKTSELRWLYTTDEGYAFLKANTTEVRSSGMFHSHEDYVAEFIEEALPLFDFRDPDQLRRFFRLSFTSNHIYGPYPKIKKEMAERIVRKLQDEVPHELQIVSEFFDGIEEEYTEFEVNPEFEGLTAMELLLLHQQGIEVGKERQYKGYKETHGNGSVVHFTPEEARTRFIIDYYKNYYGS